MVDGVVLFGAATLGCGAATFLGVLTPVKRFGIRVRTELFPGTAELALFTAMPVAAGIGAVTSIVSLIAAPVEWQVPLCWAAAAVCYVMGCITYPTYD